MQQQQSRINPTTITMTINTVLFFFGSVAASGAT
jgi:hypothetical protein